MHPTGRDKVAMSALAYDEIAARRLEVLEGNEQRRTGEKLDKIRPAIAIRIGIAPGTAENIRRRRSRGVREWVAGKIRAAYVRELQAEMARLTRELQLVFQNDDRPDQNEVAEIRAAHEALGKLIEEAK